jgi:hypothetical protein
MTTNPPKNPTPTTVTVTRTGGFAGLMQRIEIARDGSWVFTDLRSGTVNRGRLSVAQRQELTRLVSDPAFLREAGTRPAPGGCADAFVYTIAAGELSFRYEQCGATKRPRTDEILNLILAATPI